MGFKNIRDKVDNLKEQVRDKIEEVDVEKIKESTENFFDSSKKKAAKISTEAQESLKNLKHEKTHSSFFKKISVWGICSIVFIFLILYLSSGNNRVDSLSKNLNKEIVTIASSHIKNQILFDCTEGITSQREETIDDQYIDSLFSPIRDKILKFSNSASYRIVEAIDEKNYDDIVEYIECDFLNHLTNSYYITNDYKKNEIIRLHFKEPLSKIRDHIIENRAEYNMCGELYVQYYGGSDSRSFYIIINGEKIPIEPEDFKGNPRSQLETKKIKIEDITYILPTKRVLLRARSYKDASRYIKYKFMHFDQKFIDYVKNETDTYIQKVKSGDKPIENKIDAIVYFNASLNTEYLTSPPLENTQGNQYFAWDGTLQVKQGDEYICWNVSRGFWGTVSAKGFIFKNVQKKFVTIQAQKTYTVVGKYVGTGQITLVSGEQKAIPILSDVYIF